MLVLRETDIVSRERSEEERSTMITRWSTSKQADSIRLPSRRWDRDPDEGHTVVLWDLETLPVCVVLTACQYTPYSLSRIIMLTPHLLKSVSARAFTLHHTCSHIFSPASQWCLKKLQHEVWCWHRQEFVRHCRVVRWHDLSAWGGHGILRVDSRPALRAFFLCTCWCFQRFKREQQLVNLSWNSDRENMHVEAFFFFSLQLATWRSSDDHDRERANFDYFLLRQLSGQTSLQELPQRNLQ